MKRKKKSGIYCIGQLFIVCTLPYSLPKLQQQNEVPSAQTRCSLVFLFCCRVCQLLDKYMVKESTGKAQKWFSSSRTSQNPLTVDNFYTLGTLKPENQRIVQVGRDLGRSLVQSLKPLRLDCTTSPGKQCSSEHSPWSVFFAARPIFSLLSTTSLRSFSAELLPSQLILACMVVRGSSFTKTEEASTWKVVSPIFYSPTCTCTCTDNICIRRSLTKVFCLKIIP